MRTRKPGILSDEKVIELFLSSPKTYISGEAMGQHLGVSRVSIWQRLVIFKQEGFELTGERKKGYTLSATPPKPYIPLIAVLLKKIGAPAIEIADSDGNPVTDFALSKHLGCGYPVMATFAVPKKSCYLSHRNAQRYSAGSIFITLFRQITAESALRESVIESPIREAVNGLFSDSSKSEAIPIVFDYLVGASGIQGVAVTVVVDDWLSRVSGLSSLEAYPFRTCPSLLIAATLAVLDNTLRDNVRSTGVHQT